MRVFRPPLKGVRKQELVPRMRIVHSFAQATPRNSLQTSFSVLAENESNIVEGRSSFGSIKIWKLKKIKRLLSLTTQMDQNVPPNKYYFIILQIFSFKVIWETIIPKYLPQIFISPPSKVYIFSIGIIITHIFHIVNSTFHKFSLYKFCPDFTITIWNLCLFL